MINYYKLAIPGIFVALLGGGIMGLLAFNFYPEKHVNINIGGECYEFFDDAFYEYQKLSANKDIELLKLQLGLIRSKILDKTETVIPISFSGNLDKIDNFIHQYDIAVSERHDISNNDNVKKIIIKGNIKIKDYYSILNNLTYTDLNPLTKTIAGSVGIERINYLTDKDKNIISDFAHNYMKSGLEKIISDTNKDIKPAECRTKIVY